MHRLISDKLERIADCRLRRLMIFCPPGHGKSQLSSIYFPAWYLGTHPDRYIITASYGQDLSNDFGRKTRNLIASEEFQSLFGQVQLAQDSQASYRWHTSGGGSYVAAGVGTALTGRRAHVALIDDPVKDDAEAQSELYRERFWNWYRSVLRTRLMPRGAIVLIQTRWHEDDAGGRLEKAAQLGGEQWETIRLPALAEPGDPLGREVGEALWPEWFSKEELETTRDDLIATAGERFWSALYQQSPTPDEGTLFKREWIRYYDRLPEGTLAFYAASDYAVTEGGGDYTVHLLGGIDAADDLYLTDCWRQQSSSDVWVESQIDLMGRRRPIRWAAEKGQIEKSIGPFLRKRMRERRTYCHIEGYTSAADKPTRAQSFIARMAQGKILFPHAPWVPAFISELLKFPAGTYDDCVDTGSLLCRMLDTMGRGRLAVKKESYAGLTYADLERQMNQRKAGIYTREVPFIVPREQPILPDFIKTTPVDEGRS